MNRIDDLFGRKLSIDPARSKNKDNVIEYLNLGELKDIKFPSDGHSYSFDFFGVKYTIGMNGKQCSISDGTSEVVFNPTTGSESLADAIVASLVKYNDVIYKVILDNHPGYESTNLYNCDINNSNSCNLIKLIDYLNSKDNKLYRSFKIGYNNFLKLAAIPDVLSFNDPKIVASMELNINALLTRLDEKIASDVKRFSNFINGIFVDNKSQLIYETIKSKKPIDKISVIIKDDGTLGLIDGIHRLAVLWALGYEMVEALVYGDRSKLVN